MASERIQSTLTREQFAEFKKIIDDLYAAGDYIDEHKAELMAAYPERWVGVLYDSVLADAGTELELVEKLRNLQMDPAKVWCWLLTSSPRRFSFLR